MEEINDQIAKKFGATIFSEDGVWLVKARLYADLSEYLEGLNIRQLAIGPDSDVVVLIDNVDLFSVWARRGDFFAYYRDLVESGNAINKIVHFKSDEVKQVKIPKVPYFHCFIQPVSGGGYLLVSSIFANDDSDSRDYKSNLNAWLLDETGMVRKKFRVGTSIEVMQVTSDNRLWVGYFDEGIYSSKDNLSRLGFSCFDFDGNLLYPIDREMTLGLETGGINVVSGSEIWFAPLGQKWFRLDDYRVVETIATQPFGGSNIFAIAGRISFWAPDLAHIPHLHNKGIFQLFDIDSLSSASFKLLDDNDEPIIPEMCAARGSRMLILKGTKLFEFDLQEFIGDLKMSDAKSIRD